MCMIYKPRERGGLGPLGAVARIKKKTLVLAVILCTDIYDIYKFDVLTTLYVCCVRTSEQRVTLHYTALVCWESQTGVFNALNELSHYMQWCFVLERLQVRIINSEALWSCLTSLQNDQ
jgi:hypothetical protein